MNQFEHEVAKTLIAHGFQISESAIRTDGHAMVCGTLASAVKLLQSVGGVADKTEDLRKEIAALELRVAELTRENAQQAIARRDPTRSHTVWSDEQRAQHRSRHKRADIVQALYQSAPNNVNCTDRGGHD